MEIDIAWYGNYLCKETIVRILVWNISFVWKFCLEILYGILVYVGLGKP